MVELFDLPLTERKDDSFGRVVTNKSLTIKDLVDLAVSRRTDLNPATITTAIELLNNVALEQLANGASVNLGLCHLSLGVQGVFIGDNARWDASQHALAVKAIPTAELRDAIKSSAVNVRGMAASGIAINSLVDVASGEVNSRLTPGGGVNLTGTKIKLDGDNANVGITLTNVNTQAVVTIPRTSVLINDPSKITFVVPANLPNGDYTIAISTQFSTGNKTLKETRTGTLDYILNVGDQGSETTPPVLIR
jgi:hypothetical protein